MADKEEKGKPKIPDKGIIQVDLDDIRAYGEFCATNACSKMMKELEKKAESGGKVSQDEVLAVLGRTNKEVMALGAKVEEHGGKLKTIGDDVAVKLKNEFAKVDALQADVKGVKDAMPRLERIESQIATVQAMGEDLGRLTDAQENLQRSWHDALITHDKKHEQELEAVKAEHAKAKCKNCNHTVSEDPKYVAKCQGGPGKDGKRGCRDKDGKPLPSKFTKDDLDNGYDYCPQCATAIVKDETPTPPAKS
jgi:Zn finger protein HypA/HybF involved in hydrogenase expression